MREKLRNQEFVKKCIQNLIDDHETDGHQEASRMQGRSLAGSFEEALLKSGFFFSDRYSKERLPQISESCFRFGSWPEGETITAMTNGSYQITHAELIRVLFDSSGFVFDKLL